MTALALVGPTASGKTALALQLGARHRNLDVVAIDAMSCYSGMSIGTAAPTAAERALVRHHLVGVVDPSADLTVVDFAGLVADALHEITSAGRRPLLVGGTGLHLRAIVDGLTPPGRFPHVVAEIEAEPDVSELHRRLTALDPVAASRMEPTNRRRIVRALEVCLGSGRPFSSFGPGLDTYGPTDVVQVGLRWSRAALAARIERRVDAMLAAGWIDEVAGLLRRPIGRTARQAIGVTELIDLLEGRCGIDEARERIIARTRRFATRQERWFRRDPRIEWVDIADDPLEALELLDGRWSAACEAAA